MRNIILSVLFIVYSVANVSGEPRIAGGEPTSISNYPFAASLLTNGGVDAPFLYGCGGTIITTNAILSAASCFVTDGQTNSASWWRARVGSSSADSGGTIYFVNRITINPNYSNVTRANDVAVLRTTLNIGFQANVTQAARIAGAAYALNTNQEVWAVGWGAQSAQVLSSPVLRRVQIWVANQSTCSNRYNNIGFAVTDNMVCAGWLDVGIRGQCQGDTGSPLIGPDGAVVGVFSWAEGCVLPWFPAINTRVSSYVNWIVSTAIAA